MNEAQHTQDSISICLQKADGGGETGIVDGMKATGKLRVDVYDSAGNLKDFREINNLVVTVGKAHIASLLQDRSSVNEMAFMAIGVGTGSPSAGDTDLNGGGGELARVAATRTNPTTTSTKYASTYNPGVGTSGAITEAGIFNATGAGPASGTMLSRATFSAIAKASGDTLSISWTITIS